MKINIITSIILALSLCFSLSSCNENTFTIDITLSEEEKDIDKFLVYFENEDEFRYCVDEPEPIDTIDVVDGKCSYSKDVTEIHSGAFRAIHKDGKVSVIPTTVFFIPGEHAKATYKSKKIPRDNEGKIEIVNMDIFEYENTSKFYEEWSTAEAFIKPKVYKTLDINAYILEDSVSNKELCNIEGKDLAEMAMEINSNNSWEEISNIWNLIFEKYKENNNAGFALYLCAPYNGALDFIGYEKIHEKLDDSLKESMYGKFIQKQIAYQAKYIEKMKKDEPGVEFGVPGELLDNEEYNSSESSLK